MDCIRQFVQGSEAAAAVEYAVLLALILVAIVGAIGAVGSTTGGMWGGIDASLVAIGLGS